MGRAPAWRALRGQVAKGGLRAGLSRVGEQPAGGAVLGRRLTGAKGRGRGEAERGEGGGQGRAGL